MFQSKERLIESAQGNRSTHLKTSVSENIYLFQRDGGIKTVQIPTHYQPADSRSVRGLYCRTVKP